MSYYKKGDLIKVKRTGRFAQVNRDGYTKVYLDSQDHDMIAHGMGEYAGSYETAVDVTFTDNGERRIIRISRTNITKVSSATEASP